MREFIYPVIIAVSVITTFTTPYMIKAADPVTSWLLKILPAKVINALSPKIDEGPKSKAEQNVWSMLLKSVSVRVFIYSIILFAICLAYPYLGKMVTHLFPDMPEIGQKWVRMLFSLLLMSPFLYGLAVINNARSNQAARTLIEKKSTNIWLIASIMVVRVMIASFFVVAVVSREFHLTSLSLVLLFAAIAAIYCVSKFSLKKASRIEDRFFQNLNAKELEEKKNFVVTTALKNQLRGYDLHIGSLVVSSDSAYIGRTLREMPFRHTTGVNIIKIVRGSRKIIIPGGDEIIYPADVLYAVGTSGQLKAFKESMKEDVIPENNESNDTFVVKKVEIKDVSPLCHKSLRELNMRASGCMVVSVLRSGVFNANPKPDSVFLEGDLVWIAGPESSINWFIN